MTSHYTPKQAAEMLSVSVSTLRRIADEFSEHLPDYHPVKGERRTFTDADLRTVYAIHSRLQDQPGQTRAALLAELSEPGTEPLIIPARLPVDRPVTAQDAPESPQTGKAIQTTSPLPENALQPFLAAQNETQRQIDRLSARIEQLSTDRPATGQPSRQEWRFAIAIALSFGLLLAGVAGSVLFQTSQAALITSVLALLVMGFTLIWPTIRR